ncbi:MAG: hypothetical protein LiPW15_225 [Parcubacteria group bacterium LiPW_15]|nr:MAG: hypothetical protein LiPW15_225 [Parcubacteria group bacterium LiPW_15]
METKFPKSFAWILGLSIIIAFAVFSYSFYSARQLDNSLSVTGSARKQVVSDSVKWMSGFSRTVLQQDLKSGYAQMAKDQAIVIKFLQEKGIADSEINISTVFMGQNYYYDKGASTPKEYNLNQTVEVKSSDVQKITDIAKNIQGLIDQGVIFSTQNLEYYYSKLSELRVSLLAEAMKDAEARAKSIVESGGAKVGPLKSASMGPVQVLSVGSQDVMDYGSYDTSKIDKDVMVTVRAAYTIK